MPNARVGAVPQPSMKEEQRGKMSKGRYRPSKGITMEDLKNQTSMRLAQEQSRRPVIPSSNRRPSRKMGFLPSSSFYNRKRSDIKVKSIDGRSNDSSAEVGKRGHNILNWNRKSIQPSSAVDNSRYKLSSPQNISNLHQNGRVDGDRRRDIGPSEQYQQQVNHHFNPPVKSRYRSHEVKPQQDTIPSMKYKKHMPPKSYRHGLTVQELKEMTRSRLASESSGNERISTKPSVDPVRQMAKDTHLSRGHLSPSRFHISNGQKPRSLVSGQPTASYPGRKLSSNANANQNDYHQHFGNGHVNQVPQQQAFPLYPHSTRNNAKDHTTYAKRHQDNLSPVLDSYSNDGFENNSVHSINSGFGSEYLGSENSMFASSLSDCQSPGLDLSGVFKVENRRSNHGILGRRLFPAGNGAFALSPSEFEIQKNDSFQSSSDSYASSHSTTMTSMGTDSVYSGILAKDSSETLPTINLSADSHYDSEESIFVPLNFGSKTLTNSYDSEEIPNFRAYGRKPSDGAMSRNGDLPNSVAESVFSPFSFLPEIKHSSTSKVVQNGHESNRNPHHDKFTNNPLHRPVVESSGIVGDIYNRKSWEEHDDMSIAQFLNDFESRLHVNPNPEVSSLFTSKIDPEFQKHENAR